MQSHGSNEIGNIVHRCADSLQYSKIKLPRGGEPLACETQGEVIPLPLHNKSRVDDDSRNRGGLRRFREDNAKLDLVVTRLLRIQHTDHMRVFCVCLGEELLHQRKRRGLHCVRPSDPTTDVTVVVRRTTTQYLY